MRWLLDTHVLIWAHADERRLSREQTRAIRAASKAREPVGIAAISLWELARVLKTGKLRDRGEDIADLFDSLEDNEAIDILPLTPAVARIAAQLPEAFPGDPGDRLIAATALVHGLTLLTSDERIRASGAVDVL